MLATAAITYNRPALTGLEVLVAGSDLIGAFPLEVYEARGRGPA